MTDNDGSEFQRPEHYIRYIGMLSIVIVCTYANRALLEPLESDLAIQVEYDMDEQGATTLLMAGDG